MMDVKKKKVIGLVSVAVLRDIVVIGDEDDEYKNRFYLSAYNGWKDYSIKNSAER